jgi:S1-C subfamily serine protease
VQGRQRILRAAGGLGVAAAGAAAALGGAAAFGGLVRSTTTVQVGAAPVAAAPASFEQERRHLSVAQIFRRSAPGVVQIATAARALGSGFVVDKVGHVVTSWHVVAGVPALRVSFSDNDDVAARVVGADPSTDVALLQVDAHSRALTPLVLGDSDAVRVGDAVVAIGNPLGRERVASTAIVSARPAPDDAAGERAIGTDALLAPGTAGGPLLDVRGRVVGITTQLLAVPIDTVKEVVAQILRSGKVEHASLGVSAVPIEPALTHAFPLPVTRGLLVEHVLPGGAAARAGVRGGSTAAVVAGESYLLGGDVIAGVDGVPATTVEQLRDALAAKRPGQRVALELYRGSKKVHVDVKLGRQPASRRASAVPIGPSPQGPTPRR